MVDVIEDNIKVPPRTIYTGEDYVDDYFRLVNNSFLGVTNPLLVVAHATLDIPSVNATNITSHPERGLKIRKVTEYVLSLCARTYNVSISGGVPTSTVLDTDWGVFHARIRRQPGAEQRNLPSRHPQTPPL